MESSGLGNTVVILVGLLVLVCGLIGGAVWMYGRQSAKRRQEMETRRRKG